MRILFPIPLPQYWYSANQLNDHVTDPLLVDWIASLGSLTVRIKELGIAFNLEVLNQCQQDLSSQFKHVIDTQDSQALFREVLLKQGERPLVYAQTIMPESTLAGAGQSLSQLGNQSLGQVLFQSPQAIRGNIEFTEVKPGSELGQYIAMQLRQPMTQICYMRRSLFHLNHKPLLVCECFLPSLFQ